MTTVLLIRHGRTASNAQGVLAGWTPGVSLDAKGKEQAQELAQQLATVPIDLWVSSPLERCLETLETLTSKQSGSSRVEIDERLAECRYGDWTGQKLVKLSKDPLWRAVQEHPSSVHFPGHGAESLIGVSKRANEAVRYWVSRVKDTKKPKVRSKTKKSSPAVIAVVSHGDVIKAILAESLGMHLDMFQRIVVDPCSVSVVTYTESRPYVLGTNMTGSGYEFLRALRPADVRRATVGGGSGVKRS